MGNLSKCQRCGGVIHLVKVGKNILRWVTNEKKPKDSWKCMPTRDFPVRSHQPGGSA